MRQSGGGVKAPCALKLSTPCPGAHAARDSDLRGKRNVVVVVVGGGGGVGGGVGVVVVVVVVVVGGGGGGDGAVSYTHLRAHET